MHHSCCLRTGIAHNRLRVYRLIGSDLYSASVDMALNEQHYIREKENVVYPDEAERWLVVIRGDEVQLWRKEESFRPQAEGL